MSVPTVLAAAGLGYMFIAYSVDLLFLIIGWIDIRRQKRRIAEIDNYDGEWPFLSVIIPCFNEEETLKKTLPYLKEIDYPSLKIIFVNDGSSDNTLKVLKEELSLQRTAISEKGRIPTQSIKEYFASPDPRFSVIDKVNGGKADSLNCGINLSDSQLICCVDADTIIRRDALRHMVYPIIADAGTVAVGGNVRIMNDSTSLRYFPFRLKSPLKTIAGLQVIEYIRSINIARNALALINANLIISGAFGVFRTEILRALGGYEKFSRGEDMELLTRIHFHLKKQKKSYRIQQVYTADSFTTAPESYRELKSQRKRWQVGLVSTLRTHARKFFHYPFSTITLFSLPYYLMFETISPIVQLLVTVSIPVLIVLKVLTWSYLMWLLVAVVYSALINSLFLIIDFRSNSYYSASDQWRLLAVSLIEPFYYHQLNCYWKLLGTLTYMRRVFVKAGWTPPRGRENYQSQIGRLSVILDGHQENRLRLDVDYKSLYTDRIVIMTMEGSFDQGDIDEFDRLIEYLKGKNRKRFILDVHRLEHLSADGLSTLVSTARQLRKKGGRLVILNAPEKIADECKISNVVKEIKLVENYSDAISEVKYG